MDGILLRIAEAKAAWALLHPEENAQIVALGEKVAAQLKRGMQAKAYYSYADVTLSARVLGLHVEEDPALEENEVEIR